MNSLERGPELLPAIDLRGGRCVRLLLGDYEQETVYGDDPVAQARAFVAAGAPWVHVVDLDAARSGEPVNRPVVAAIAAAVDVPVQTGGGVRTVEDARALFAAGVTRVVLGTAAVATPGLVDAVSTLGRVAVGLDVRGREVAVHGWTEGSGLHLADALEEFGMELGCAFQAVDDVLGIWGDPSVTGKAVGNDLRERKKSLPVAVVLDQGGEAADELLAIYGRDGDLTDGDVARATAVLTWCWRSRHSTAWASTTAPWPTSTTSPASSPTGSSRAGGSPPGPRRRGPPRGRPGGRPHPRGPTRGSPRGRRPSA